MELTLNQLTRKYGEKIAVDNFSAVFTPKVYGLLGANGAGKTTLMRLICDILKPTSGSITLDGVGITSLDESYREKLGYDPQHFGYYPEFTAYDYMLYIAALKGIVGVRAKDEAKRLLDIVGLSDVAKKKIKTLSGGMQKRLGIAQAMLGDPSILILDEPTAGLDPKERVHFRNLISSFASGKIVILSTHIVSDIEYIAAEIMMMKQGRLVSRGDAQTITGVIADSVWEATVAPDVADRISAEMIVGNIRHEGDLVHLRILSDKKPLENAVHAAPNLEDLYLHYFKEESK
ncbi:ABC transporter ATP-binding protein [Clostridia bacterium]|nr:ABC transporter ATP-binding protein [Clostridia bacterium]